MPQCPSFFNKGVTVLSRSLWIYPLSKASTIDLCCLKMLWTIQETPEMKTVSQLHPNLGPTQILSTSPLKVTGFPPSGSGNEGYTACGDFAIGRSNCNQSTNQLCKIQLLSTLEGQNRKQVNGNRLSLGTVVSSVQSQYLRIEVE